MSGLDRLSREELIGINLRQAATIEELTRRVQALEAELEKLRPGGGASTPSAPDWVKPNRKERRAEGRKKRKSSFVRRKAVCPTKVICHAPETCPDCNRKLSGGWVHRTREVIDIPSVPVEITHHQIIARRCGVCGRRVVPKVDFSRVAPGKSRIGLRLMSLVAELHIVCRIPIRTIRALLKALYGLDISQGELTELLHRVAARGQGAYEELGQQVRGSPVVNADETGWREDGVNGYVWSFSTPEVRYFVWRRSRGQDVAVEALGEDFGGVLVSDFYSGYNRIMSRHQRCWVHLLRDLDKLEELHPEDDGVSKWVGYIKGLYAEARAFRSDDAEERLRYRYACERALSDAARPFVKTGLPEHTLAERIERFLPELFVFVEDPRVPPDNNAAERAVRPVVIARKISGGTRSAKGSRTRQVLASLFGTWAARGDDTLEACHAMLAKPLLSQQP